jgi:hypothetical protein
LPDRNFDEEREARLAQLSLSTFVMRGHTFTIRDDVNPNVIILFDDLGGTHAEEKSQADQIRIIDEVMQSLVMPSDAEAYQTMRATDSPGLMELLDAAQWCVEQITSRPFGQASGSGTSPTGQTSPVASTAPALRVAVGESGITASETPST